MKCSMFQEDEMTAELTRQKHEETDRILEERARIMARRPQEKASDEAFLQLLTFSLGQERFGVEVGFVQEVHPLKRQSWSLVPCTPDFIVGAVNIRGRIYSMMHVGRFLGIKTSSTSEKEHLLLVRGSGDMELCIVTDDMPEVERIPKESIQPSSGTISVKAQEYIHGVTKDMLTILNLKRILADPAIIVNEDV